MVTSRFFFLWQRSDRRESNAQWNKTRKMITEIVFMRYYFFFFFFYRHFHFPRLIVFFFLLYTYKRTHLKNKFRHKNIYDLCVYFIKRCMQRWTIPFVLHFFVVFY